MELLAKILRDSKDKNLYVDLFFREYVYGQPKFHGLAYFQFLEECEDGWYDIEASEKVFRTENESLDVVVSELNDFIERFTSEDFFNRRNGEE